MDASLHQHDRHVFNIAKYKLAPMPLYRGNRKSLYLPIGYHGFFLNLIAIIAQPGPQYNADSWLKIGLPANLLQAILPLIVHLDPPSYIILPF